METGERASCRRHRAVRIVAGRDGRPDSGYLASVTTEETGLGSGECPWLIETRPGQRINLTLHNFAPVTPSAAQSNSAAESDEPRRLEVCHGINVHVYSQRVQKYTKSCRTQNVKKQCLH